MKTIIIIFAFNLIFTPVVFASEMESSRYRIQMANVNSEAGKMVSTSNVNLSTTLGELAAGQFIKTGYIVKAGFQYIHSIIPLLLPSPTAILISENCSRTNRQLPAPT